MSESEEATSNNESSPAVGGSVEQAGSDGGLPEGRRYFCKICDIGFSTFPSLKDHLGSSHTVKITSRLFFCQSCEESFRFQQSFHIHLHKVHTAETVDTCIKCGFKLPHERTIPTRQSGEPHPEHYCIVCQAEMKANKREAKKTVANKTQSHGGTKTQSSGKDASKRTELKNGGTKKTFKCELCHSRYSCSYNLNKHLLAKHGVRDEDKPHRCGICQRGFSRLRDMRVHLQRVHVEAETKPHACDACGKAFARENQLLGHSRLHDRERCDVCLKVVCSSYMRIHMRTHLNIKPYACILCDKSFALTDSLKAHVRTHTGEKPHFCETCGRAFRRREHLRTHLRVHTGEKPYVCDVCQRGFSQKWVMYTHRRIHTGERPFECDVCQRGFIYKSQLKTHRLTHAKDQPEDQLLNDVSS